MDNGKNEGGRTSLDRRKMMFGALCAGAAYATYKVPDLLDEKSDREEIGRLSREISGKYQIEVEVPTDVATILAGLPVSKDKVVDEKRDVRAAYTFVARRTLEAVRNELHFYPREYLHAIGLTKIMIGSRMSGVMGMVALGTASQSGQIGLYVGPLTNLRFMRVYGVLHHELGHLLHLKFITEFNKEWANENLSLLEISEKVANLIESMFAIYLDNSRRPFKTGKEVTRGDEAFSKETQVKVALIKRYIEQMYPLMNANYWDDVVNGRVGPSYWDERKKVLSR